MAKDRLSGKLAVILHADVVGSTTLVQENEQLAHERIQETFHRFGNIITQYHGHVRELRGDALLAEFERASDAVTAALTFQEDQIGYNAQLKDSIQPTVRVGIAMGEVIIADDTITGTGVVLAQRLEQLSQSGGVVVQGAVYETIPGRFPYEYEDLGRREVKGFEQPVRIYSANLRSGTDIPQPESLGHGTRNTIIAIATVAFIITGIALMWFKPWEAREELASVERMAFQLPDKPSIAVLPFTNMSGDTEQEYFVDGMTEDIITDLSKVTGLFVISRNSVFAYKGKPVKVHQVAEELGVRYVLEGSVRRVGDHVRINAQLIDATTDGHLWAERYDGSMVDVFALQDNVTGQIVGALELKLASEKPAAESPKVSTQAYDDFLKGWALYQRHSADSLMQAVPYLKKAVRLDKNYAQAHTALAAVYWEVWSNDWVDRLGISLQDAMEKAKQHLEQGMVEATPLAHWVASNIEISNGNYQKAILEAEKIIFLDKNNAAGYAQLADALELLGKRNESLIEKAVRLNPHFSPIHTAAKTADIDAMKRLLAEGMQINTKDYYGKTPLHVVSENGYAEIAILLIDAGADVEATTKVMQGADLRGATPLVLATKWGHINVAKLLVSAGADVNARDPNLQGEVGTVLHYAVEKGHTDIAKLLIDNGASIDAASTYAGLTPLALAARKGHRAVVELLVKKDANVNAVDASGDSILHAAAVSGNSDIIQLLLANEAQVNAKTAAGDYPGETPLHVAAYGDYLQIAELLLANGAGINAADQLGHTPLRRAVDNGHLVMAELLLDKGADVLTTDTYGVALLHSVAYTDNVALAKLLIKEGADVNAKDINSGLTPLDYAQDGEPTMIELLEKHGSICTSC